MPLKLYRRDDGDIWYYRGTVAGRRLRGTTGTAKKEVAQRFIRDLETRQWKGHFDGPEAILTFAQAAILYRDAEKATRFLDKVRRLLERQACQKHHRRCDAKSAVHCADCRDNQSRDLARSLSSPEG